MGVKAEALMRSLVFPLVMLALLVGGVVAPVAADPLQVEELVMPPLVKLGGMYTGVVKLNQEAPAGGVEVVFLPTNLIKLPQSVDIDEGESEVEFDFRVIDMRDPTGHFKYKIEVTTMCNGKTKKWPGPKVKR